MRIFESQVISASTEFLTVACIAIVMACFATPLQAQALNVGDASSVTVRIVDGRNGKPVKHQRVIVFMGYSPIEAMAHGSHVNIVTDADGASLLAFRSPKNVWLQFFVDGMMLCYSDPNKAAVSADSIMSDGVVMENDCGAHVLARIPGRVVIFARPATFMEKMRR